MSKRIRTRSIARRVSHRNAGHSKVSSCIVSLGSAQFQKSFESIVVENSIPAIAIASLNSITSSQIPVVAR